MLQIFDSAPKTWEFFITHVSGNETVVFEKKCLKPSRTSAWKLLDNKQWREGLNLDGKIESWGYRLKYRETPINELISIWYGRYAAVRDGAKLDVVAKFFIDSYLLPRYQPLSPLEYE